MGIWRCQSCVHFREVATAVVTHSAAPGQMPGGSSGVCFGSTFTTVGIIQRLAWPVRRGDTRTSCGSTQPHHLLPDPGPLQGSQPSPAGLALQLILCSRADLSPEAPRAAELFAHVTPVLQAVRGFTSSPLHCPPPPPTLRLHSL